MPFPMTTVLACAVSLTVVGLIGQAAAECSSGTGPEGVWARHGSGFTLAGLDGLVVACGVDEVSVIDPAQPQRTSQPAIARLLAAPPAGDWPEMRLLADGTDAYFRIDASDGGSGGTEYAFTAWRRLADGILLVEQHRQFEPVFASDPPDDAWSLVWTLVEGARQGTE